MDLYLENGMSDGTTSSACRRAALVIRLVCWSIFWFSCISWVAELMKRPDNHKSVVINPPSPPAPLVTPPPPPSTEFYPWSCLTCEFEGQEQVTVGNYVLKKRSKRVRFGSMKGVDANPFEADVAYATLRRGAKPVATFPGLEDAPLNNISIGAYPLLGGTRGQLIISATAPRMGHHIIVALQPKMRVIFDSSRFNVAREDLSAADLDNDGVSEIAAESLVGYSSELNLPMSDLPLPVVVFRYNAAKGRYLPANKRFKEVLLQHQEFKEKHTPARSGSVGDVLDSTLTYIYACERAKGWAFFDKNYLLADKSAMQASLKKMLEKDPVYRYIYGGTRR